MRLVEEAGVISGVGHHFFHVIAGFVKRNGFGINRALERGGGLPAARAAGACVVAGGGHHFIVAQAAFGVAQIPSAHADVAVHGVQLVGAHADFAGDFARGGGHHLHQAVRAHIGACAYHKAAFLADQAVYPGRIYAGLRCVAFGEVAEGRDIAQVVVELFVGALGAVDGHFVKLVVKCQLGGGEQSVFIGTTGGIAPFGLRLAAHVPIIAILGGAKQGERAVDGAVACKFVNIAFGRCAHIIAGVDAPAQLFGGQHGIEIAPALGHFFIKGFGTRLLPLCSIAAGEPIAPVGGVFQFIGHAVDDAGQIAPSLQAQGGAGIPFELVVGKLAAIGAVVIAQRGGHVLVERLRVAEHAPSKAALRAAKAAGHGF